MPAERFGCPSCRAVYKRVRVSADAKPVHQLIYCTVKHPLGPTQDGEILKYFLVERPCAKRKAAASIAAERRQA